MDEHKLLALLSDKEKKQIIRIGKMNDNLNKYCIKITMVPVCIGVILILASSMLEDSARVFVWGMGILLFGCLLPLMWFIVLNIIAKGCKNYSYGLYEMLIGAKTIKDYIFELNEDTYPYTSSIAKEQFAGNVNEAIKYIILNIRGEEINKYINEWTPEQSAYAVSCLGNAALEKNGEKKLAEMVKNVAKLEELGMSEEEVLTKPNPFVKKIKVHFLILIGLIMLSVVFGLAKDNTNIIVKIGVTVSPILMSLESLELGNLIVKFFGFRKMKKKLVLKK